jgi:iron complex outermembrane receptor protein
MALLSGPGVRTAYLIGVLGVLLGSAPAVAANSRPPAASLGDLSLEQLMEIPVETVFSASKYEQKITRAPASVTIVSAREIGAYGHRTLAEILRSVRGLYVSDDSNYSYLGTRGFLRPGDYNSRVLVLVDGHRLNENIYDASYFGRGDAVDVEAIDRVEFIRGPSSSIYGSSAFFGVLNVVTKRGPQTGGTEVSAETGSFGSYRGRIAYGNRLPGGVDLALSASYAHSQGQAEIYYPEFDQRISAEPRAANQGIVRGADGESALRLSGHLTYRDLTIACSLSSRTKAVPTASYDTIFNGPREETTDNRAYVDITYHRELRPDLRLLARAFYDAYSYRGDYPYDWAAPGQRPEVVMNRDRSDGEWVGTEWQLTGTMFQRHTVIAGLEFRENLRQDQFSIYETVPPTDDVDDHRRSRTLALFAQGEFSLGTQVLINAGVRYDHYFQNFGGTVNPRVGLIYNPQERTTLKLLYGRAFRAPNVYERFYIPNPFTELVPEKIATYEIAVEHYFTQNYRLGVSAYHYGISRLITQAITPAGDIFFENLDRAKANGIEWELEGKYASGLRLRASYALQRTKDLASGAELTNSPRHLAKAGLIFPLGRDRFTAGLEAQYHGATHTLDGGAARDFLLGNLTLTAREVAKGLEVSASIYNLADTKYGYPGAEDHVQRVIPQPGRTFNVKATYKY